MSFFGGIWIGETLFQPPPKRPPNRFTRRPSGVSTSLKNATTDWYPAPNITKISTNAHPQKQYRKTKPGAFSHIVSWRQKQKIAPITNGLPQQPPETIWENQIKRVFVSCFWNLSLPLAASGNNMGKRQQARFCILFPSAK